MAARKSTTLGSPREVVGVIDWRETMRMTLPPRGWIEVKEKMNGSWVVFYPDPGWIPCAPNCDLQRVWRGHKHDYERGMVESTYKPTSYEDALAWAEYLAEGGEIKIIKFLTLAERKKQQAQESDISG